MSRKKRPKPDDKEQSARFVETAGQIQSDNPREAFEDALNKIVKKIRKTINPFENQDKSNT
jgi:arylamine N-acetyltransferase